LRHADAVVQAKNFTNVAHGQSLGRHLDPLRLGKRSSYPGCRLSAARTSWLPLIAIAGNSDHDRLETVITMLWNG
jgi:hypothetical protein